MKKIIADIYGCMYGSVKEFGLADSADANDLDRQLQELKPRWDDLCPSFHEWFLKSTKMTFKSNVIEWLKTTPTYRVCFTTTLLN